MQPTVVLEPSASAAPVARSTPGLYDGQDLFRISLRMRSGWMVPGETVELRFPEVLRSSAGVHLLDHYLSGLGPHSDPSPLPEWRCDTRMGAWSYSCELADGVTFAARAQPAVDEVHLEFSVTNGTADLLTAVEPIMCLDLKGAPDLGPRYGTENLFASLHGELRALSTTTPSATDMQREPWLLIRTEDGAGAFPGPQVSPTWWCVDQLADRALMAARSADGKHLLGYAWEGAPQTLMSNGGNPCLHAGPAAAEQISPGATATFRGSIYFVESDLPGLVARYDADRERWNLTR